jgi:hypothetical protein
MLPKIVVMNHSAPFLCSMQRHLKTEPFDLYLYYQTQASIAEITQLAPDVIVLARRYGFPYSDEKFIHQLRRQVALRDVPIILSLVMGMSPGQNLPQDVRVITSAADYASLDDIMNAVHEACSMEQSHRRAWKATS